MNTIEHFKQNGFIIQNIFSNTDILLFKNEVNNFIKNNNTIKNSGGITIPNFIKHKEFVLIPQIINNNKIHNILKQIFNGDNYRFCQHNDIGINRIVGWHKDKLNGKYSSYETVNIWEENNGEKHEIVKVLIYLADHSNNNDGLKVVPKSHLKKEIQTNNFIQLKPKIGDVIIFDQRITHRGMAKQVPMERILISFGFGKNNIFTDNFEKGTIARQNEQNNI